MKIGVDARVLVHRPTGVARYVSGILSERQPRADESITLFVDRSSDVSFPGNPDAVVVASWPFPGGDPAWRQMRLPWTLARHAPDVLFCPFYTVPLMSSIPSVVTIHDVSFAAHPEWFRRRARWAFSLAGRSAAKSERVLTVSRFSADEITRYLGVDSAKIDVVYAGVEAKWFESVTESRRDAVRRWLGTDAPYLLQLGAVHARRNVDVVLRSFAAARDRLDGHVLAVVGPDILPGPDVAALASELGIEDRVIRKPWCDEELISALLAESDALIYLSSYEGFGLPALEAMATGAPVLAYAVASLPEVLGECAVWVDRLEPDHVSDKIVDLLTDDAARRQLAEQGRRRAETFRWKRASDQTFDILRAAARA